MIGFVRCYSSIPKIKTNVSRVVKRVRPQETPSTRRENIRTVPLTHRRRTTPSHVRASNCTQKLSITYSNRRLRLASAPVSFWVGMWVCVLCINYALTHAHIGHKTFSRIHTIAMPSRVRMDVDGSGWFNRKFAKRFPVQQQRPFCAFRWWCTFSHSARAFRHNVLPSEVGAKGRQRRHCDGPRRRPESRLYSFPISRAGTEHATLRHPAR